MAAYILISQFSSIILASAKTPPKALWRKGLSKLIEHRSSRRSSASFKMRRDLTGTKFVHSLVEMNA